MTATMRQTCLHCPSLIWDQPIPCIFWGLPTMPFCSLQLRCCWCKQLMAKPLSGTGVPVDYPGLPISHVYRCTLCLAFFQTPHGQAHSSCQACMSGLLQVLQARHAVSTRHNLILPALITSIKQALPTLNHSASLHMVLQTHVVDVAAQKERSSARLTPTVKEGSTDA